MKLIVIAGMYRSGSTLLYNMVRLVVQHAGHEPYCTGQHEYDPTNPAEWHIVKAHKFDYDLAVKADYIFCTHRPVFEIDNSLYRWEQRETDPTTKSNIRNIRENFNHDENRLLWENVDREFRVELLIIFFHDLIDWQEKYFGLIYGHLFLDDLMKQLPEPPTDKNYDPVTMLFKHHVN